MNKQLKQTLYHYWGYSFFRDEQEDIILNTLAGKDGLVLMPTGGGKSLCYQLPALLLPGLTIVVSPLISLMKDQVEALKKRGIKCAYLNSSLTKSEQYEVEKKTFFGDFKLLYVSPERIASTSFKDLINECEVSLVAIDEAHCVSQWGHDFRPEYSQLGQLKELLPGCPFLALTATAGESTREDILKSLQLDRPKIFISGFERPNIQYLVQRKKGKQKDFAYLAELIKKDFKGESGIIYCLSRKKTEEIRKYLRQKNIAANSYHAGLSTAEREKVQYDFIHKSHSITVATIAFGMGIDKANIRFVIHMDMPKSLEGYYQETGRAGRDGKSAVARMLYGKQEYVMIDRMNNRGTRSVKRKRLQKQKLDAMLGYCESSTCRREVILNYFSDPYQGPCGNCDICLNGSQLKVLVTPIALKVMEKLHQSGIKAKKDDVILNVVDASKGVLFLNQVEMVFRELVSLGAIRDLMDGTQSIQLTHKALSLIKEKKDVFVLKEGFEKETAKAQKRTSKKKQAKKVKSAPKKMAFYPDDEAFLYLKEFRKKLAKKKRTKPFKVFPDQTLYELVQQRPKNLDQLQHIYGVGPKKIKRFGQDFIDALAEIS